MKTDPWYQSKRLYAAVIMVIVSGLSLMGYQVDETMKTGLMEVLTAIGTLVSIVLVVWSKLKEQKRKSAAIKSAASISTIFLMCILMFGCAGFKAPDNFTKAEKVQYTTLKTLKSAKIFKEFALESAGSIYKNGLMKEDTKEKIINLGDELQQAINSAADALIAYKEADGLSGGKTLEEKITAYQKLFNQFMEIVTPYVMDIPGKEVS